MRVVYAIFFLTASLCFISAKVKGQHNLPYTQVELGGHAGFVWPHSPDIVNLKRGEFPMFQLGLSSGSSGEKPWHHTYNFPETGITFMFSHLGYPEVIGHAWGVLPHITLPLHRWQKATLQLRYSAGIALFTNYYKEPDNMRNLAISTPLNITMNTTLQLSVPLTEAFSVRAGIGMTHFSNGRTQTPNKGLNIPSAKLELLGHLKERGSIPNRLEIPESFDKYSMIVYLGGGYSRIYPPGGPRFAEFSASTTVLRRLSPKAGLGLGSDIFFGFSDRAILRRTGEEPEYLISLLKPGIHLSYEQVFTNTSLILQQGIYLYAANNNDGLTYNRLGIRHTINDRWVASVSIKSHLFRADFLEWGAGLRVF